MRALEGLRIVVTRTAHQAEELARPLRELGAEVILLPVIAIAPPADPEPLRRAAEHANEYDWIIFTSANAVRAFVAAQECKARIAVVGAATRRVAEKRGFTVSLTPTEYVAESLIEAFQQHDLNGQRILIPTAAMTRDVVASALRERGAQVDVVEAYRNVLPPEAAAHSAEVFRKPYPDWVTFASSSAVKNLVGLVGADALRHVRIATIGPITSETVRACGLELAAEASSHTTEGLLETICQNAA